MAAQPLTTQQQQLIQALLLRSTVISEAARSIRVEPATALAWMQKPYMRDAFDQARREMVTRLIEEAKAGKIDEAMGLAAIARLEDPTAIETSLKAIETFADSDPVEAAALLQRLTSELQAYRSIPLEQLLVWK